MPFQTRPTSGASKKGRHKRLYGKEVYTQGIIHTEEGTQGKVTHGGVYTKGNAVI